MIDDLGSVALFILMCATWFYLGYVTGRVLTISAWRKTILEREELDGHTD